MTPEGTVTIQDEPRFGRLKFIRKGRIVGCYNYHPFLPKPYIYPLIGIGGKNVVDCHTGDHFHHRGIWYAHQDVNGHDFYLEHGQEGVIRHEGFSGAWQDGSAAGIVAHATWLTTSNQAILRDVRTMVIRELTPGGGSGGGSGAGAASDPPVQAWALDLTITLIAGEERVVFSDTKEAGFPLVRVADHLDALDGGVITIAGGLTTEAATFGKRAAWIDYSGPVGGFQGRVPLPKHHGIAIFDHPSNPGHPPAVFTRDYGPISTREGFHFEGGRTLDPGERLTLAHRIYLHEGDVATGRVAEAFEQYAKESPWLGVESA